MNTITIKDYEFNSNYSLKLDKNIHRMVPEYIVMHLQLSHLGGPQVHDNASDEMINRIIYQPMLNKMRSISFQILINKVSPTNEDSPINEDSPTNEELIIENVPLSFLFLCKKPIKIMNKIYISLDNIKYLIKHLNVYSLNQINYDITCKIKNWEELVNHVEKYDLITKNYMYENEMNENVLSMNIYQQNIQQMCSFYLECNMNCLKTHFEFHLYDFIGSFNGFFIECDDVSKLLEIDFLYNRDFQINYDKFLIEQYTEKISERMIYFSFNPDNLINYVDINKNNKYRYNFEVMNQSIVTLNFLRPQKKVGIHGFTQNKFLFNITQPLQYEYNNFITILQNNSLV